MGVLEVEVEELEAGLVLQLVEVLERARAK